MLVVVVICTHAPRDLRRGCVEVPFFRCTYVWRSARRRVMRGLDCVTRGEAGTVWCEYVGEGR